MLASFDEIERLHEEAVPPPIVRNYERPGEADNDLGAWYVTTDISTGADGPLAGRRVAVKDNIAVAGVPMANGSLLLAGFVPRRDASVVARLLAAGATIAGKAVREPVLVRRQPHREHRPGPQPLGPRPDLGRVVQRQRGPGRGVAGGHGARWGPGGLDQEPKLVCGVVGHKPTHGLVPYTGPARPGRGVAGGEVAPPGQRGARLAPGDAGGTGDLSP